MNVQRFLPSSDMEPRYEKNRRSPLCDTADYMEVETLVKRLGDDGYTVDTPEMSIEALAEKHGAETDAVLLSVFRE